MDLRLELGALMLGAAAGSSVAGEGAAQSDPLASWNDGPAKEAILKFVHATEPRLRAAREADGDEVRKSVRLE